MMKPSTFFYNIGQGFKGIFRNSVMTIASVLVLVACMILVGTFYIVIDTIDRNFKAINDLNVIEVKLSKEYSDDQVEQIGKALEEICKSSPIIDSAPVFISADEHGERMRDMFEDPAWIDEILKSGNPLRASYRLEFRNFSDFDEVTRVRNRIDSITITDASGTQIDGVDTKDIKDYIELYGTVMSVKNTLYVAGIWLLAILLIISLFVIMNTIKLGVFARRNEITFMRLCGATKAMIRMPFMVEGIIIGVFSAALAFGIEYYLFKYLLTDIVRSATSNASGSADIILGEFSEYALPLGIGFLAIGLFAGIVSSGISLKKYLKA